MIHAFNFSCNRDLALSMLMVNTFKKHCQDGSISVTNTDVAPHAKGYGNGSGWQASMMKLKALSDTILAKQVSDDDYILSVDSDVVFTSPEVFKYVTEFGIIGTKHRPEFYTHFGPWSHMSGALIFFRGDVAKRMAALRENTLNNIRFQHFKAYNLTENEDVVLSYLARNVGANYFDLGTIPNLSSGNFESDISTGFKSFYHLNYCPTRFLGKFVTGKWDIPEVLTRKGVNL